MATTEMQPTVKLWDVEPAEGNATPFEAFVVEASSKADADNKAAERLASLNLPAAKFKLTASGSKASAPAPRREAKPDPKPGAAKASAKATSKPAKGSAKTVAKPKATSKPAAQKPATAKPAAKPRIGARQIAVDILKAEGGPLHTKVLVERILADPRATGLKGRTPGATIAAMLAVDAKKADGTFVRTAPGTFALREQKG